MKPWKLVFDNDEGGEGTEGAKPKTFTQDDVNRLLAENKRSLQTKNQEQLNKIQELTTSLNGTQEEKDQLAAQIEELRTVNMTAEDIRKRDVENVAKEKDKILKTVTDERDHWQNQYRQHRIKADILATAQEHEAFNPNQIHALLASGSRIEQDKATGEYHVRVRLTGKNKEGKAAELDFTPSEALAYMKDNAAEYGNLFKSGLKMGLGDTHAGGDSGPIDYKDPAAYRSQARKEGRIK